MCVISRIWPLAQSNLKNRSLEHFQNEESDLRVDLSNDLLGSLVNLFGLILQAFVCA